MFDKQKKLLILFLVVIMCIASAGCKKKEDKTISGIPIISENPDYKDCVDYPAWKGVELTSVFPAPTEEEILQYAQKQKTTATTEDPSVAVQSGDRVNIDYHGEILGQSFPGGDGSGVELTVGDNSYIEGFEDAAIGMHPTESKTFLVTIPEGYAKALAGQEATFTITINSITRPETVSDDDLKAAEEALKASRKADEIVQLKEDAWNYMFKNSTWIKIPRKCIDKFEEEYDEDILKTYKSLEDYFETKHIKEEDYNKAKKKNSENKAKAYILTMALKEEMGISEDSKEFKKAVKDMVEYQGLSKDEMEEAYGEGSLNEYVLQQIESQKIADNAKITYKK